MTRSLRLLVAASFVVAALGIARATWAACNVIPDPTVQLLRASAASGAAQALRAALAEENATFGGMVPYKGALGRIGRVLLSAENKKPILVAADRRCVPDKALPSFQVDPPRGLVAAMIVTPAKGRPVAVLATGGEGGDLSCTAMTKLSGEEQQLMLAGCKDGGVEPVKSQTNVMQLTLPTATAVPDARATKIVLLRGGSAAEVVNTLRRLAATDCESLCGEAAPGASIGVCIDKIYAPTEISSAKLVVYGGHGEVHPHEHAQSDPVEHLRRAVQGRRWLGVLDALLRESADGEHPHHVGGRLLRRVCSFQVRCVAGHRAR